MSNFASKAVAVEVDHQLLGLPLPAGMHPGLQCTSRVAAWFRMNAPLLTAGCVIGVASNWHAGYGHCVVGSLIAAATALPAWRFLRG